MKLISTTQLIESTIETVFIKKHPYELSTLTTSQVFSTTDVTCRMMKEAKDVEDSTVLSASGYSNGQIETLNGASPKACQKILDVNKSPLSFDVTVKKVIIPPQWEKLNSSSSSESFTLNRSVTSNGIPVDSMYDNESDIVLSEEEIERNSLGFDFVDDSEKFGLSDSEVDKLLKDVEEKDKSDVPKSTKTSEEEENGIDKDSNNETFTAAGGATCTKSGNLADMLLSNFEKQLQSGFEAPINVNISNKPEQNHVYEKEIKTNDVPKVFNKSDSKIENTVTNTTESIQSDSKQSEDNHSADSKQSEDNHSDVVAQSSLVTEKSVENSVDIDKLKQNCLETESGNESSHNNITEHESKENESCISKSDDSPEEDSSNSKTTELLGSNAKYDNLQHEDTCNKTADLLEDNALSDDSQDKESFNKTGLLENSTLSDDPKDKESFNTTGLENSTLSESQDKESSNKTDVLENNISDDSQDKESINNKHADENKNLTDEINHLTDENHHLADEIALDDKMPDTEMKNSEVIEVEGDLESEVRSPEADELQDDLMETNEISSDIELQDITQKSDKSLDADDIDMDESHNDKEISNYSNEKSVESVMHSEVTENSMNSEIQDEKDAELESNTDFQNESLASPANESNNAQDVDERYEQISDSELTSNSITQLREEDSELPTPSTDEKEHAEKISDTIDSSDNENSLIVDTSDNENSLVQPEHSMDNNKAERLVRKRTSSLEDNDERVFKRTKAAGDFDSSDSVPECIKDSDSAIEKETTEVVDNSNRVEKEDQDSSDKVDEIKNVEEVSESLKENKMEDETNDENEKSISDSVCDEKKIKENEKMCSVEKDVQSKEVTKESEVVRTGIKRVHEHIGLIEVKKVRITPEMESQLSKLSNAEKLQKSSTANTAKVLLVDKNAIKSTNDHQNDQHKQTDSESVSVDETESKEKDDCEIRDSSNDVTKSKESSLAGKEDSSEGKSEEKKAEDKDKSTDDKLVGNKIGDKLENEKKKDVGRTTPPPKLKNSLPPRSPKSNLDLAIERVVLGLTDEPEEITISDKPKEPKNLNPMPFMRNLQDNLLKKLSRNDLEEILVQKMCEAVTDRCTIGDMRQRCQTLEQMLEQWRKKVQQLQKQLKDMEMVMKRYIGDARTRKERPIPVKITRSVGLQVHMGPMNAGMLRNRPLSSDPSRNQGQVRRRANRVSSPSTSGTTQQNQQQQSSSSSSSSSSQPQQQSQQPTPQQPQKQTPQHSQKQTPQIVGGTAAATATPVTVQKVVTAGFTKLSVTSSPQAIAPRPSITTVAQMTANKITKIVPSPVKPIGRPITSIAAVITTGTATSTINTMNTTIVNTANTLRIASAAQLNNRQPVKQTSTFTTNKAGDHKIIDLTDEEDRAKSNNTGIRTINPVVSTVTASMISTSAVTTGVPITAGTSIQAGSIRVVQPHQLTGSTTATLLAPSTSTTTGSRFAYFVPTSGGPVQQRQVLIASPGSQVRPGVMNVQNRQTPLPTLVFKNGTVVPIQQASGTQSVNTTILRPGPPMQAGHVQQVLPTRPGQQIRVAPSLVTTVGRMTTPTLSNVPVLASKHPAPLPNPPVYQPSNANWKLSPPKPELKISKGANKHQQGIVLSWNMTLTSEYEEIASYQLYAYQEGAAQPSTTLWKKVGDVKALPLPMACTLTQFMEGHKYHFAVRAVDVHMRVGPFSTPGNIVLTRK